MTTGERGRLDELENSEAEGQRNLLLLTCSEYTQHVRQLNELLTEAWQAQERVKAVKLAIQNAKLLSDATVLQFYPSMFVLVTDLLDNFAKLVFDRIKERGAGLDPHTGAQLPPLGDRFSHKQVSDLAKETCRNWFYKIASVKELLPRVFVEIAIDNAHLVQCIAATLPPETKLTVMGTIQFATAMFQAKPLLEAIFPDVHIPQAKPLSPGEVLGCTSPVLAGRDALVFVADGRFHLESAMIHNPHLDAYRYDPYGKALTRERYDHAQMHAVRKDAVAAAQGARTYGVILGTLGRQGNPAILKHVEALLHARGKKYFVLLLTEIFPDKLARFGEVDAWIQIACPRLSIDWGYAFAKPLLSPYEAEVALKATAWRELYPMDFYAAGSGPWTNYHKPDDAEGGAAAEGEGEEEAKGVGVAAAAGF